MISAGRSSTSGVSRGSIPVAGEHHRRVWCQRPPRHDPARRRVRREPELNNGI